MRSEIKRLYAVGGKKLTGKLLVLPWQCFQCDHVRFAQGVNKPRGFRALAAGRLDCSQGLELPAYGRLCPGLTLARKTAGNERPQKALPFDALCSIVKAPNLTSPDRRLALATQPAKALCTSNQTIGLAAHAVKVLSILAGLQCPGTREDPAASLEPGSIASLPFLFPRSNEVHNV